MQMKKSEYSVKKKPLPWLERWQEIGVMCMGNNQ